MSDEQSPALKVQIAMIAMPFLVWIVPCLVAAISPMAAVVLFVVGVLLFPLVFAVLFSLSKWFRNNCILIVPFWFVSHILLMSLFGFTQGAVSAAISKSFSSVDLQIMTLRKQEKAQVDSAPSHLARPATGQRTSSGK